MASTSSQPHLDAEDGHGPGVPWRKVFGLLLLGLLLMGIHGWSQYDGLTDPETMELAALARNMAQGRGFIASCVRPVDLWFIALHTSTPVTVEHMPDIRHGPVFPSLLAAVFLGTGMNQSLSQSDFTHRSECFVILPMTICLTLVAGLFVYLTTRRLVGDTAALLALALFVLSLPVLQIGLWGGASALLLFLGSGALLSVVRCVAQRDGLHGDETAGWLAPVLLAGFLAGLAMLTRYGSCVLVLAMLVYLFHGHERPRCWLSCLAFLCTVMVVLAPWVIRNVMVTGAPFGVTPYLALNNTLLFEGNGFDASLHPLLGNLAVTRALKTKLLVNCLALLQGNFASVGAGVLMVLFGMSIFVKFENDRLAALRHSTLAGLLVMIVVVALGGGGSLETMTDLLPCMFVLATAGFYVLLHNIDFQEPEQETLAVLALLLWTAAPVGLALLGSSAHRAYPPYHPPFIRHISSLLSKGETLCSDIPWATAWYGGRTSVLLPRSVDSMLELRKAVPSLTGLYITTQTARMLYSDQGARRSNASWRPLLFGQIPPDFPFTEAMTFPPSSRDQWFFTDRKHLSTR